MSRAFNLAPMSPAIKWLTYGLWLLPLGLGIGAILTRDPSLAFTTLIVLLTYGIVWFACRPIQFLVQTNRLTVIFPIWKRQIPLADISRLRVLNSDEFRQEFGLAMRIGVGGLWGGFGWLWTQRQGMLEFYISRLDQFILVERHSGHSLLITPEQAMDFIAVLRASLNDEA